MCTLLKDYDWIVNYHRDRMYNPTDIKDDEKFLNIAEA
jgi:hypothetical protein